VAPYNGWLKAAPPPRRKTVGTYCAGNAGDPAPAWSADVAGGHGEYPDACLRWACRTRSGSAARCDYKNSRHSPCPPLGTLGRTGMASAERPLPLQWGPLGTWPRSV